MSSRITPMPSFSSLSALNSELFCSCQSTARYGCPSVSCKRDRELRRVPARLRRDLDAGHRVAELRELRAPDRAR